MYKKHRQKYTKNKQKYRKILRRKDYVLCIILPTQTKRVCIMYVQNEAFM